MRHIWSRGRGGRWPVDDNTIVTTLWPSTWSGSLWSPLRGPGVVTELFSHPNLQKQWSRTDLVDSDNARLTLRFSGDWSLVDIIQSRGGSICIRTAVGYGRSESAPDVPDHRTLSSELHRDSRNRTYIANISRKIFDLLRVKARNICPQLKLGGQLQKSVYSGLLTGAIVSRRGVEDQMLTCCNLWPPSSRGDKQIDHGAS